MLSKVEFTIQLCEQKAWMWGNTKGEQEGENQIRMILSFGPKCRAPAPHRCTCNCGALEDKKKSFTLADLSYDPMVVQIQRVT